MKSILPIILMWALAASFSANAHAPTGTEVPSRIEFLNLTLQLDDYAKGQIQEKVNSLNRSKTYYQAFLDRCHLYFPIIDAILEREGVPTDFKYVALHESTLKGDAVSTTGATGYWQFKDFTAVELGMKVNNRLDERSNIISSTEGAAKYLKKNYAALGNWLTTLISHNRGLGGTQRSIGNKYNGKKIIKIDRSTPAYVFLCLANKIAFEDALNYRIPQKLYIHEANSGDKLSDIAHYTNVNLTTLQQFNRWTKKDVFPNDRAQYKVLIPIAIQDEKLIAKALSNPKKKKDKPTLIADNNPTPTEKTVFEEKTVAPSESKSKYPVITKRKKVTIGNYSLKMVSANGIPAFIAEKGQSPAKVADFLGMSAKKLMKINDLQLFDVLEEGKVYYIQPKKTKAAVKTHTVQTGETVWEIAHVYGITVDALRDKNQLSKKEEVKAGRVLLLRKKLGKNEKPTYQKVVPPKNTPKPFEPEPNEIIIGKKEVSVKKTPKEKPLKEKAKEEREYTRQKEEEIIKEDRNPTNNTPRFPRNAQIHVIKQNETVMTILQRYGLSIKQFKEWNPMDDYLSIPAGTALMVGYQDATLSSPTVEIAPNSSTVVDAQVVKMKVKNPNPSEIYHIVQKGDTLYSISRKYQVSVQAIQRNNRKLSNTISIGEKLLIQ